VRAFQAEAELYGLCKNIMAEAELYGLCKNIMAANKKQKNK